MEIIDPVKVYGNLRIKVLSSHVEILRKFGPEQTADFIAIGALSVVQVERAIGFVGDFSFEDAGVLTCEVYKDGQGFRLLPLEGENSRLIQLSDLKIYELSPEKVFEKIANQNGFALVPGSFSPMVGWARRRVGSKSFQLFTILDESIFIQPGFSDWINAQIGDDDGVIILKPSGATQTPIGIKGVPFLAAIPSRRNNWLFDRTSYCGAKFKTPADEVFKIYPEAIILIDEKQHRVNVLGQDLDIKGDAAVYKFIRGLFSLEGRKESSEAFADDVLGCSVPEKKLKTFRDAKSRAKAAVEKSLKNNPDCEAILERLFPRAGAGLQGLVFTNANQNEILIWS